MHGNLSAYDYTCDGGVFLPLPGGEDQGEGEPATNFPPTSNSDIGLVSSGSRRSERARYSQS